jgi:hypothetical protein
MFIRQKQNKSGSTSVHIVSKARGKYKIVKSIGSTTSHGFLKNSGSYPTRILQFHFQNYRLAGN